jgi:hypothetical protein
MKEFLRVNIELTKESPKFSFRRRCLDVFDNVELDVALAKDVRRAA